MKVTEGEREKEIEGEGLGGGGEEDRPGQANFFSRIGEGTSALQVNHINICGLFYTVKNI